MNAVLQWCLNHPETVIAAVLALATIIKGRPWVDAQIAKARKDQIFSMAHLAFHAVEEEARLAPESAPLSSAAKAAAYLDKIDSALEANGAAPLAQAEKALATTAAQAINAVQKAAAAANP